MRGPLINDLCSCVSSPQTYLVSGTNEQGQRAAIRQVAIDMKLNIVMATKHELEVLKDSNVIGKRAPCAGLLTLEEAEAFLRAFGYPHIAVALRTKALAIKMLDLTEVGKKRTFLTIKTCTLCPSQPTITETNEQSCLYKLFLFTRTRKHHVSPYLHYTPTTSSTPVSPRPGASSTRAPHTNAPKKAF